jgi:NAD-dependent dihydropyrimidine dehydrogenase PreA subunit
MNDSPRWLTRDGLERLLARLARESSLIGPVDVEGEIVFLPVTDPAQIARDYVNSLVPPKEYLLPTPDRLLEYRVENGVPMLSDDGGSSPPAPRVVFGIRSCDVAGLAYLERWFSGELFGQPETADGPFMSRREATTLISVTCARPGPTCMCVCCKGGPALERGYDWQLTELPDGWLVEIGSARGERLAAGAADLLLAPPPGAAAEKAARVRATVEHFGEHSMHRVPTMAATRMVSSGRIDGPFWKIVGDRCFECGGCAFVCPTCWCFNVADVAAPGEAPFDEQSDGLRPMVPGGALEPGADGNWERVRMRDCCNLAGFIRQAGGGYPRVTCGERCVTRFFHKLSQQFHERMDAPGCTGCGRCVQVCLGEEGIDAVAEGLRVVLTGPGRASTPPARILAGAVRRPPPAEAVTP